MGWFTRHIAEDRLGRLAEEAVARVPAAPRTPEERAHIDGCQRCRDLLIGHERALTALIGPWTARPLPSAQAGAPRSRPDARPRALRLVEAMVMVMVLASIGLGAIALSSFGGPGGRPVATGGAASMSGSAAPAAFRLDEVKGRLAYSIGSRLGPTRIQLFDFRTAESRTVTPGPLDRSPNWSPDGQRLAFVGGKLVDGEPEGLWVGDADGSNARLIYDERTPSWPSWSPDGRWIAFVSEHGDRGASDIFIIAPDGTGLRQLSDSGVPGMPGDSTPDNFWGRLGWSPDSRSVVTGVNTDPLGAQRYEIRAYFLDGGTETLVSDTELLADPAWSPDGTELLFSSASGMPAAAGQEDDAEPGGDDLMIRRADGRIERFADIVGYQTQPAWSPDGRYVAFLWDVPDSGDIGILRVADKAVVSVTDTPLEWFTDAPAWCAGC